ncbi:hypothetical protein [Candidatus Entotheonella palauensis]|uniref:hypothetical protein n=1 Tax=Candidatus Entotheonella palauensis TaxID=93172 RepID=UPI000B7D326C|nr:hypothetical protein [Candidatus Entotheonella palauensis]
MDLLSLEKGAARLEKAGFTKGNDEFWVDADGNRLTLDILGWPGVSGRGQIIQEQLRRAGVDATFSTPPDNFTRFMDGDYVAAIFGHGGSVAQDPYYTLRIYQSKTEAIPGLHQVNFAKWTNAEFDKIVDEMFVTSPTDQARLMELYHDAMEIWLSELPDLPLTKFYHHIVRNETYWKGWPSQEDPYINEAIQHFTWQLVLNRLEPAQ